MPRITCSIIGPGRGEHGGELVWNGGLENFISQDHLRLGSAGASRALPAPRIAKLFGEAPKTAGQGARAPQSLTRDYLTRVNRFAIPKSRRKSFADQDPRREREQSKNIDVEIPLGVFTCVTGVSGSGKSTLIHDVLYRNLLRAKGQSESGAGACKSLTGAHRIGDVVMVDQSPLARTPRSTPILYLGLFDRIRELFAAQPEAMAQGLTASAFSFNSGSGRCERCCGHRFREDRDAVPERSLRALRRMRRPAFSATRSEGQLHGKSIHDMLEMTVSEAIAFFAGIGEREKLCPIRSCAGGSRARLSATRAAAQHFSGGESQRLKLVRHLTESGNRIRGYRKAR